MSGKKMWEWEEGVERKIGSRMKDGEGGRG